MDQPSSPLWSSHWLSDAFKSHKPDITFQVLIISDASHGFLFSHLKSIVIPSKMEPWTFLRSVLICCATIAT